MAKENGRPTAEEKGKGKVVDEKATNGEKSEEKLDKDGKPISGGKKGAELVPAEGL